MRIHSQIWGNAYMTRSCRSSTNVEATTTVARGSRDHYRNLALSTEDLCPESTQTGHRIGPLVSPRQVIVSREHVRAHHVEEVCHGHMLVAGAHAGRRRTIHVSRNVAITPETGVGSAQADDRHRLDPGKLPGVGLQDLDHLAVWIAIGWGIEVDLLRHDPRVACDDLPHFLHDGFLVGAERQANVGLDPALTGDHVDLQAT